MLGINKIGATRLAGVNLPPVDARPATSGEVEFGCLEDTPVGTVYVAAEGAVVRRIGFRTVPSTDSSTAWTRNEAALSFATAALQRYFAGDPLDLATAMPFVFDGTSFQEKVWAELTRIPYGQTLSYGELARRIGQPGASRAVGMANNQNPLPILVPCHRVIGASGDLVGFGSGLDIKRRLLELEGSIPQLSLPM